MPQLSNDTCSPWIITASAQELYTENHIYNSRWKSCDWGVSNYWMHCRPAFPRVRKCFRGSCPCLPCELLWNTLIYIFWVAWAWEVEQTTVSFWRAALGRWSYHKQDIGIEIHFLDIAIRYWNKKHSCYSNSSHSIYSSLNVPATAHAFARRLKDETIFIVKRWGPTSLSTLYVFYQVDCFVLGPRRVSWFWGNSVASRCSRHEWRMWHLHGFGILECTR